MTTFKNEPMTLPRMKAKTTSMPHSSRPGKRRTPGRNRGRAGGPERIRTPDLLIRSQPLYPTELRAQAKVNLPAGRGFVKVNQSKVEDGGDCHQSGKNNQHPAQKAIVLLVFISRFVREDLVSEECHEDGQEKVM